jgi:hypothetical protein
MISDAVIGDVEVLLNQGHSLRRVALLTRVSRGTVLAVKHGRRTRAPREDRTCSECDDSFNTYSADKRRRCLSCIRTKYVSPEEIAVRTRELRRQRATCECPCGNNYLAKPFVRFRRRCPACMLLREQGRRIVRQPRPKNAELP